MFVLGIICYSIFSILIKYTSFFEEPITWWKFLLLVPMIPTGFVATIGLGSNINIFIKHKLKSWGMFDDKASNVSFIIMFVVYGIWYLWLNP